MAIGMAMAAITGVTVQMVVAMAKVVEDSTAAAAECVRMAVVALVVEAVVRQDRAEVAEAVAVAAVAGLDDNGSYVGLRTKCRIAQGGSVRVKFPDESHDQDFEFSFQAGENKDFVRDGVLCGFDPFVCSDSSPGQGR